MERYRKPGLYVEDWQSLRGTQCCIVTCVLVWYTHSHADKVPSTNSRHVTYMSVCVQCARKYGMHVHGKQNVWRGHSDIVFGFLELYDGTT